MSYQLYQSQSDMMMPLREFARYAAEWLGRAAPVGAKYWEIGNECYGTWETDLQSVAHDPTTYANRVQAYMAKMKAVDPTQVGKQPHPDRGDQ